MSTIITKTALPSLNPVQPLCTTWSCFRDNRTLPSVSGSKKMLCECEELNFQCTVDESQICRGCSSERKTKIVCRKCHQAKCVYCLQKCSNCKASVCKQCKEVGAVKELTCTVCLRVGCQKCVHVCGKCEKRFHLRSECEGNALARCSGWREINNDGWGTNYRQGYDHSGSRTERCEKSVRIRAEGENPSLCKNCAPDEMNRVKRELIEAAEVNQNERAVIQDEDFQHFGVKAISSTTELGYCELCEKFSCKACATESCKFCCRTCLGVERRPLKTYKEGGEPTPSTGCVGRCYKEKCQNYVCRKCAASSEQVCSRCESGNQILEGSIESGLWEMDDRVCKDCVSVYEKCKACKKVFCEECSKICSICKSSCCYEGGKAVYFLEDEGPAACSLQCWMCEKLICRVCADQNAVQNDVFGNLCLECDKEFKEKKLINAFLPSK